MVSRIHRFSILLYIGCRVSDLINLELTDVILGERSGTVIFRFGKGNKQRTVPLPLPARCALQAYLESRPPVERAPRSSSVKEGPHHRKRGHRLHPSTISGPSLVQWREALGLPLLPDFPCRQHQRAVGRRL